MYMIKGDNEYYFFHANEICFLKRVFKTLTFHETRNLICLPDFSAAVLVSKTSGFDTVSMESTSSSLSYQ